MKWNLTMSIINLLYHLLRLVLSTPGLVLSRVARRVASHLRTLGIINHRNHQFFIHALLLMEVYTYYSRLILSPRRFYARKILTPLCACARLRETIDPRVSYQVTPRVDR